MNDWDQSKDSSTESWRLVTGDQDAIDRRGQLRLALEKVFRVSLPLGQEIFSATQPKRADGVDAPSAVLEGQSVTPEVAASLRRWLDEQPDRGGRRPCSGCEASGQGLSLSIA